MPYFYINIIFQQVLFKGLSAIDICKRFNLPSTNTVNIRGKTIRTSFNEDIARKLSQWYYNSNERTITVGINDILKLKSRNADTYEIDLSDKEIIKLLEKKYKEYIHDSDDIGLG
jgi:hypothetical protein